MSLLQNAYKQAGRILEKAAGKNEEYLVAIDSKSGSLVADNLGRQGHPQNSTFKGDELAAINAHQGSVITIHNHPHSYRPSFGDVLAASRNDNVAGSVIVGHDGSVWFISAPSAKIAAKLTSAYNASRDELGDQAENAALDKLIKRARKEGFIWKHLR